MRAHTYTHTHTQSMAYYMLTTLSVVECLFILMILNLSGQSANFSLNSTVSKPSFSLTNYAQLGCSQCFTFKSSTITKPEPDIFLLSSLILSYRCEAKTASSCEQSPACYSCHQISSWLSVRLAFCSPLWTACRPIRTPHCRSHTGISDDEK